MEERNYPEGIKETGSASSDDVRGFIVHTLNGRKGKIELSNIPRCVLAVRAGSITKGDIDIESVNTDIKVSVGDQYGWIERSISDGFQLIFVFDDDKWKLYDNGTKLKDDEVMEILTPSEVQKLWERSRLGGRDREDFLNNNSSQSN